MRLNRRDLLHFLPGIAYVIYTLLVFAVDKLILNHPYFLTNGEDPDFDTWYQIIGFLSIIGYFLLAIIYYSRYKTSIVWLVSNASDVYFLWIRNFLTAVLILLLARATMALAAQFYSFNYRMTWWYFFLYAIGCYYISIAAYTSSVQSKVFFNVDIFGKRREVEFLTVKEALTLKYAKTHLLQMPSDSDRTQADEYYPELFLKIKALLEHEKPYLNQEISLFDLAQMLNTNVSILSRAINTHFRMNFNDLINSYRVNEVIAKFNSNAHKVYTILSIAYDCGFNSKSTFNRAFLKYTGFTPQAYLKTRQ